MEQSCNIGSLQHFVIYLSIHSGKHSWFWSSNELKLSFKGQHRDSLYFCFIGSLTAWTIWAHVVNDIHHLVFSNRQFCLVFFLNQTKFWYAFLPDNTSLRSFCKVESNFKGGRSPKGRITLRTFQSLLSEPWQPDYLKMLLCYSTSVMSPELVTGCLGCLPERPLP